MTSSKYYTVSSARTFCHHVFLYIYFDLVVSQVVYINSEHHFHKIKCSRECTDDEFILFVDNWLTSPSITNRNEHLKCSQCFFTPKKCNNVSLVSRRIDTFSFIKCSVEQEKDRQKTLTLRSFNIIPGFD